MSELTALVHTSEMPRKEILVVDVDRGIRAMMKSALEGEGYCVTLAQDGLETLQCLANDKPDLIVLDLAMPRLDGYGFLTELRRSGLRESIRILVVTATWPGITRALDLQPDAYIQKPFELSQRLAAVQRWAYSIPEAKLHSS